MMLQLAYVGLAMFATGLASFYAIDHAAAFVLVNLIAGALALSAAGVLALLRLRLARSPDSLRTILIGASKIALALIAGVGLEFAADRSGVRFDWTFDRRFEFAPSTIAACKEVGTELRATLFHTAGDPRIRRTRLLLEALGRDCSVQVDTRPLERAAAEADRFAIGSSNSVVFELGPRFETVERPSEGAIYAALRRLRPTAGGVLVALRGEGEGDFEREDDMGYSGLLEALTNEGYRVRGVVTASMGKIPEDAEAVVVLGPRRFLQPEAIDALRRYLETGGSLVALIEPGIQTGLEDLLAEYGLASPNAVIIDPVAGAREARAEGIDPIGSHYNTHAITRGLDANRVTFFSGARSFELRKARPDDRIQGLVLASPQSWLSEDLSVLDRRSGRPDPGGARRDYHPLVVSGSYRREAGETRIVAFGDRDFCSNRHLRAVYNLDLILNAVAWATQRESDIAIRPKAAPPQHFPLPLANSLQTFYGVGLLIPEFLLIAGGLIWLRTKNQ
jgi:hypothetical protein